MNDLLKFFREHKLTGLAVVIFGYVGMYICFRAKSTVLFDILVLVGGSVALVAIYRWQPKKPDRAETQKLLRRRKRRHHHNRR